MAVSALPSQEGRSSARSSGLMRGTVRWYGMETGGPDGPLGDPPGAPGGPEGGCPLGNPTIGGLGTLGEPPFLLCLHLLHILLLCPLVHTLLRREEVEGVYG
jgi:hypothetical protein